MISPDSFSIITYNNLDSSLSYSGTIKIQFGRQLFVYKKFGVDAFVAGGYRFSKSRRVTVYSNSNPQINDQPIHSVLADIVAEPKIWLWKRLALGAQVGTEYSYSFYKTKYTYSSSYSNGTRTETQENKNTSHSIEMFGDVSLTGTLLVQILF